MSPAQKRSQQSKKARYRRDPEFRARRIEANRKYRIWGKAGGWSQIYREYWELRRKLYWRRRRIEFLEDQRERLDKKLEAQVELVRTLDKAMRKAKARWISQERAPMKCPKCGYEWFRRLDKVPRECPACRRKGLDKT